MKQQPRVALMRNRIYPGGIFHVMLEMIRVLNQRGIVPDLVTLKSKVSPELAAEKYNMDVEFRVREILADVRIPYEWHILLFNKIIQEHLRKYDLVINHNNTSFLYRRPEGQKLISYVHFPRKVRGLADAVSIHMPEGRKKKWHHFRSDPFKLTSLAYRFDRSIDPQEHYLANSQFTRQMLLDFYEMPENQVEVMYPPVDIDDDLQLKDKDESLVVSLGRFSPEKRQLEQLKIAEKLPDLNFKIMGFLSNKAYFKRCTEYRQVHNLTNVELLPNRPYEQVVTTLDRAGLFLHALENEPFGITTVEAISHGCLPIVPDSGGQKEIVPKQNLRYGSSEEAVTLIKRAFSLPDDEKKELRKDFFEGIGQFKTSNFQHQFEKLLNKVLN